ncbi:hypothetical protein, partial [Bradyrhizobium liaoningense]
IFAPDSQQESSPLSGRKSTQATVRICGASSVLEPWRQVIDERERLLLEEELRKEIGDRHPLVGLEIKVLGRRDDRDDVLASPEDGRVAEVHLTWSGRKEAHPSWPRTAIFDSMDKWRTGADLT